MRKLYFLLLLLLVSFSIAPEASAKQFGENPERSPQAHVVTEGKKLNVRSSPSLNGTILYQLRPYDVVYLSDETPVEADGYQWVKITDRWGGSYPRDGYVTNLNRLSGIENPNYVPRSEDLQKIDRAVVSSQRITKWVLLGLSVVLAIAYIYRYFRKNTKEKILGPLKNGMRKTFFFNVAPYRSILYLTLFLVGGVASAVAVMLIVGGGSYGILWIVKILCYVVMWVGVVGCIIGVICCLTGHWDFFWIAVLGGVIWYFDDSITAFGDKCADSGLVFFNELNILHYTWEGLILPYWKPVLIATLVPMAIFIVLAVIWLMAAGILIGIEKIVTLRYNIHHPCPHCQHPSEPATYLSKGENGYIELPENVKLRPGFYGLFHITHPDTREKMPTMLANGRDRLARKCANCGKRIQANEGTDLHLAMVGSAMSGKSTLTYRLIAEIFNRAGHDSVHFTDVNNSIRDNTMIAKVKSIAENGMISEDDMPRKTATNNLASTQLNITRKHAPVPYRLFINDVGGELFDPSNIANGPNATRYFRNVQSILLLLDPITTDFSDGEPSDEFLEWIKKNDEQRVRKLPFRHLMDTIDNQLEQHGTKPSDLYLNIILSKADLGYLSIQQNTTSNDRLRRFVEEEMGLGTLLHWAKKFSSCSIFAVAATAKGDNSNVAPLVDVIISGQLGIKM